jgi:glycosyltransferase involved in cell wall biosynthesis
MKNILVIAYHYPPIQCAINRTMQFTKYFKENGWNPIVLSAKYKSRHERYDHSLMQEIKGIEVHRTFNIPAHPAFYPLWFLFFPYFFFLGWFPFAFFKGLKLIKKKKIQEIYVSYPPSTSFLLGYSLSKISGIPLILDYRDPWMIQWKKKYIFPYNKIFLKLEKKIVEHSKSIISCSSILTKELTEFYNIDQNKIHTIYSGIDQKKKKITIKSNKKRDKLKIIFGGMISSHIKLSSFLRLIKTLKRIQILFICNHPERIKNICKKEKIKGIVDVEKFLPNKEYHRILADYDVGLVLLDNKTQWKYRLLGKIFDYIKFHKPILALVPEGETSRFIQRNKIGIAVTNHNIPNIKRALETLRNKEKYSQFVESEKRLAKELDVKNLTAKLIKIIDEIK